MKNIILILISLLFLTGCLGPIRHHDYEKVYTRSTLQSVGDHELCLLLRHENETPNALCTVTCFGVKIANTENDNDFAKKLRSIRKHNIHLLNDVVRERGLLNKRDLDLIPRKSYGTGMSQCGMYIVLGKPESENKSVGSYGVHIQHVYRRYPTKYVYTENGVVTSYQTSN
jgi:hypothetical protein